MLQSDDMRQKRMLLGWIGLLAVLLLAGGLVLYRPIVIEDGAQQVRLRAAVLRVGQALYAAGVQLDPADQVTPPLDAWLPLDGHVVLRRASHALLWDAGQTRPVNLVDAQAADVLAQAGLSLQQGDRLLWNGLPVAVDMALLPSQSYVFQIERALTFHVLQDGQKRSLRTRGPSVARALWDGGVRLAPGDWLSADPGQTLQTPDDSEPLTSVALQRARPFTIQAEGQAIAVRSAAATVGQVLSEARLPLQGLDYSLPAEDQPLPTDGQIRVVRVTEELLFTQNLLPYESSLQPDPTLELDQRRTLEAGQYGIEVSRERVRYADGQEISRVPDSQWIATQPSTQVVGYGTLIAPHSSDTPDGPIEYWRAVTVYATGYSPCRLGKPNYCNYRTASGATLTRGIIAVTPAWYRSMAGQRVYVNGYGFGVIADTGYGIPGTPWIDLGYDDDNFQGGGRTVTMYFLTPAPETVPWILP